MDVEIVSNDDENFKIQVKKFGEAYIASDGEHVSIGETKEAAVEGVQEMQDVPVYGKKPVPMESKGLSLFDGTMWGNR